MRRNFVYGLVFAWTLVVPAANLAKDVDFDKVLGKGYHQMEIGEVDSAIATFKEKVRKYPSSGACHTALGRAFKKRGKLLEAKSEFQTAANVDDRFADGFYELGALLEGEKEYQAAAQAFERYLKLVPASSKSAAVADRIRFCKEHI